MREQAEQPEQIVSDMADTVTEKPKKININLKPKNWWQRFLVKKGWTKTEYEFEILPITYGTFLKISGKSVLIKSQIDTNDYISTVLAAADAHGDDILYMVAVGITNNPSEPSRALKRLILENFTNDDIQQVLTVVLNQCRLQSFTNSIALISGIKVLKASPMEGGEKIAPHTN